MATVYGFTADKVRVPVLHNERVQTFVSNVHFDALSRTAQETFKIPKPTTVGALQAVMIGAAYTTAQGQIVQAARPVFLGSSDWEQLTLSFSPDPDDSDKLIASILRIGTVTSGEYFNNVSFVVLYV